MKDITVTSRDAVRIATHETGKPSGPEILFIHGFNQSHQSWLSQLEDAELASEFRMVALDLRGHGGSGKPSLPEAYSDDGRWAGDVAAVIAAADLRRPVLVGWSYGGRVITDYLREFGTGHIAGINFVNAAVKNDAAFNGPKRRYLSDMVSDDYATHVAGTANFVRACFELQPTPEAYERILAFNMIPTPAIRKMVFARTSNPGDFLPKIDVPVLLTHGNRDSVLLHGLSEYAATQIPDARLSIYDGIGHAPFHEDAPRFNAELREFVRAAQR